MSDERKMPLTPKGNPTYKQLNNVTDEIWDKIEVIRDCSRNHFVKSANDAVLEAIIKHADALEESKQGV